MRRYRRAMSHPRTWSRRAWALAALGALVLVGTVAGTVALVVRAADVREADRARFARLVAAEEARLRRVQAPQRGAAPGLRPPAGASRAQRLAARAALVRHVEAAIAADARRRVASGELEGVVRGAECGPLLKREDAVPDDRLLDKRVGRYDCVAVVRDIRNTTRSVGRLGFAFVTALDFTRFTYVWCRNTPAQGEAGRALGFVRLERACLAARGRALGTGYVDVPGS